MSSNHRLQDITIFSLFDMIIKALSYFNASSHKTTYNISIHLIPRWWIVKDWCFEKHICHSFYILCVPVF